MTTELISPEAQQWHTNKLGEWLKLGYITDIQDGNHGELHPRENEFVREGIPFVTANCIKNHQFDLGNCKYINPDTAQGLRIGFSRGGDVLLTHKGSIGFTTVVPEFFRQIVLSPQVTYYRTNKELLDADFLSLLFRSESFQRQLNMKARQATRNYVGITAQKELSVSIPPLPAQKRIAAILNEQMEAVARARQATLAQIEAGEALPAAYLRAVFNSPEAQKWERKLLGEIAILERGKFTPRPRNDPRYYGGQYPWIQTGEVEASRKYIKTYRNTLNDAGLAVSKMFPKGTLVITIAATIGAVGILTFDSCMPDSLVGITPREGVSNTEFLYNALLFIRNHLKSIAPQVAQANLKLSLLEPLEIPTPPLPEQERIAATLNEQMAEVERLKQSLKFQLDAINKLPATLLRRAFNGEL